MDSNIPIPNACTGNTNVSGSVPRLPCRGCIKDCPNYHRCEGKPWRMGDGDSSNRGQ